MATQNTFKADWIPSQNDASQTQTSSKRKSTASWQQLGLSPQMTRALGLRGFKQPTPIQRMAIPSALENPPRDILGMARTGSGKTLAYLIPMLQRLGTRREPHGIRCLILCPSRELAVQILKAGKDLSRSLAGTDKSSALRWSVIMGGESLDQQFEKISEKPDIVIATPGRFLHIVVEMDLDLRGLDMVIYDEADRLFEMGFEVQLREILHRLPASRHSLLFSATLPSSLAEFAKAGLNNPNFIRLDTEHRISPSLKTAFIWTKPDEKDAALLILLRDAIGISMSSAVVSNRQKAIIFASTKHHVEYLQTLLSAAGYRASFIYGSLDQAARQQQLRQFRSDDTDLLVVTDVAARGIDIPSMGHVINFDFPSSPRVFVHRVGRTARAGQEGSAWTIVTKEDLPFLLDLEVFLDRPITGNKDVFGAAPRESVETAMEYIQNGLEEAEPQLPSLREVMKRGQSMFERSRSKASREAYQKAKTVVSGLSHGPVVVLPALQGEESSEPAESSQLRERLLESVQDYRPPETIFEIGSRGKQPAAQLMQQRRLLLSKHRADRRVSQAEDNEDAVETDARPPVVKKSYRDPNFFLPHEHVETAKNKGYSLNDDSFAAQARSAILDLQGDEGAAQRAQKASQMKWDKKSKRFVKGDGVGADNQKMVKGESGVLLPATFKSGRFATWQSSKKRHQPSSSTPSERPTSHRPAKHQKLSNSGGKAKSELHSVDAMRRNRLQKEKLQARNGRPRRK